ncbi:glutamate racemase [Mangrovibacterium diazotrophicum]|uniref:Glutamate racemase n=1 Tax=Mangrovibacterium diazotrophicum TaxID=1261403 RepID=A0A419W528_9BACT|nr:glutamate racemase [Mangrovibacterium diazotrophicum]RKD90553.1 glutamate racemase [Mangrovibacterium diazotrophicum]
MAPAYHPIGVFDSGYGGLTVLKEFVASLPEYDFLYLGDNARTPYGTRSFDVVYEYTLEAVKELFDRGCHLVILACNTASAKALRSIQQRDLPLIAPDRRVLGVIRPSVEYASKTTKTGHVGILATSGTVASESYPIELQKWSNGQVKQTNQQACPMWVPIVENNEIGTPGANYFVEQNLRQLFEQDDAIDTLILGCTHYPLLIDSIRSYLPANGIEVVEQGKIVAASLKDYLSRHSEIDAVCTKQGTVNYLTTEQVELFETRAEQFMGQTVKASKIHL